MTIQLELDPAMEMRVAVEAKSRGITMEQYVRDVLREKAQAQLRKQIPERKMTTQEFLDAMVYDGPIPEEMHTQEITREFIYAHFLFLPETSNTNDYFRDLLIRYRVRGVQVHDARLAAVMLSSGIARILTFDKLDFNRFA